MTRRIILSAEFRQRIIDHALAERPHECVGLLAGRAEVVECVFALANEAASPTRFLAAEGLFQPMREMRAAGLELLGIYHSHPSSPPIPSQRDRADNYYPDAVHIIVSLLGDLPVVRAWRLTPQAVEKVEIVDAEAYAKP